MDADKLKQAEQDALAAMHQARQEEREAEVRVHDANRAVATAREKCRQAARRWHKARRELEKAGSAVLLAALALALCVGCARPQAAPPYRTESAAVVTATPQAQPDDTRPAAHRLF